MPQRHVFASDRRIPTFLRDRSGNAAMMFSLALVPIIAAGGAALDYSMLTSHRARLQAAVDSSALAVAAARDLNLGQRTDLARKTALGNFDSGGDVRSISISLAEPQPGFYRVDGEARAPLTFMAIFGMRDASIHATAQSQSEAGGGMIEVAMAVDVSGSMRAMDMGSVSRIDVLKQVANNLIDTLASRTPASQLKFATIPFNTTVNIGRANTAYVDGTNHPLFTGTSWAGCVLERAPPNHLSTAWDGSASPASGRFRAFISPPEPDTGPNGACLNPGDGTNDGYASVQETNPSYGAFSPMTAGPNFHCVRHAVQPLTSSVADAKAKIDSLTAEYNWGTIVTPAIVWALRALTPNAPFPGAAPFAPNNKKIIIALTDGEQVTDTSNYYADSTSMCVGRRNSVSAYAYNPADFGLGGRALTNAPADVFNAYGYLRDSDPFGRNATSSAEVDAHLDEVLLNACTAAKAQTGVEIYAIAVSAGAGPGTRAHSTLSQCASDSNHFFYAPDATALTAAFEGIANRVAPRSRVRLTR